MSNVSAGLIAGVVFGAVTVALMLPMPFPDKRAALSGAFVNRFAIGFLIAVSDFGVAGWIRGLTLGILMSLPTAIITKKYAPILITGALGGLIIGLIPAMGVR